MSNKSKTQSKSSRSLTPLSLSIIATTLVSGVAIALAWTGPGASPFAGNTPAPVNVGGVNQIKSAVITAGGLISSGGLRTELNTMLGGTSLTPRNVLEVNGNISNTAALNANVNLTGYNLGVGTIGAETIYGYNSICTGNDSGTCIAANGVVIGGSNTAAKVNITNTGNSFFNTTGNLGVGTNSPAAKLDVVGQIVGGFGAVTTAGIQDWNDISNSRSGSGYSLLTGSDTNGPSASGNYFHPFNFEYSSKTGGGNTTQLAVPYGNQASVDEGIYLRGRFSGAWSTWRKVISEGVGGNVGIGTSTPAAKLAVQGGILAQGTIRSGTGGYIFPDGTTQTTAAGSQWTTSGANIYSSNTGNVGIGSINPLQKFVVGGTQVGNAGLEIVPAGSIVAQAYNRTTSAYSDLSIDASNIYLRPGATTAMTITSAGNVGVGFGGFASTKFSVNSGAGVSPLIVAGPNNNLYIDNVGGGLNYLRGNTYFNGTFIDESNSSYYLKPSGTSITNDLRANILYDQGNTAYYADLENTTRLNAVQANVYVSPYSGTDSGITGTRHYQWGYQEGGAWSGTYPDLILGYHTGVKMGGNPAYGGVRFYTDHPSVSTTEIFSVGNGDANVRATNNFIAGGSIRSNSIGFIFPDGTTQTTAAGASVWTTTGADIFNANTGNVGIGGAPSASKLHVQAASNPQIQLRSQSTGGRGLWTTVDDTNGVVSLNSSYGTVGAYPITFQLGNIEQMRLHSNGNIGLGRTAPTSKLEVGGDSVFFGTAGTSYFSSGANNYIRGNTYFNGLLIDESNGAYYLDPAGTSITNDLRANIFYDTANTGYYVDPNATSNINNLQVTGDTNYQTVRSGAIGVYDPGNTQAVWAMANAYRLPAGGASTNYGNFYGLGWSYEPDYGGAGNNPQSKAGLSHQLLLMHAGTTRTALGNGIWSNGIIHSASGGFRFPDGTTQTTASTGLTGAVRTDVAGDWNIASNVAASVYTNAAFEIREANFAGAQTGVAAEAPRIAFHWGGRVASQIGMDSAGTIRTYNNPGTGHEAFAASNITANGTLTSTGNINATAGTVTAAAVTTNAGSWLSNGGTTNYLRGNTYANGIYFDESNSAYYLDPASTSITNDLRANILYDVGNTGYYVDPASTSNLNVLSTQSQTVAGGIINSEWYRSSGNGGWFSNTHGGGIYMADSTYIRTYGSKSFYHDAGVFRTDGTLQVGSGGATFNAPNGGNTAVGYGLTVATTGTFGGNVTAPAFIYSSDERLKGNIAPIQSSLEKVRALNGYTFNWKKDGKADVGLVAQQVETVFPELVHTDATTGLKSVQYGNLVAPLIEAVKELASSLDSLATRIFNTEVRQTELERQNQIQAQQIAELQRQISEIKNK